MRRLITPVAIALIGLFLSASAATAQPGKGKGKVGLVPGRSLPKMRIVSISQKNGFARVVIGNQSNLVLPRRQVSMRIFRGGRQIGILRGVVGAIPARGSRVLVMRTGINLRALGTVLAFQGNGLNAVVQRGAGNRFLLSKQPLSA